MAKFVKITSTMASMKEQIKKLILVMHKLSLLPQAIWRLVRNKDTKMVGATLISIHIPSFFPIVEHPTSITITFKERTITLLKKFDDIISNFWGFINQV